MKASNIVKSKLLASGGSAIAIGLQGKEYIFNISCDGKSVEAEKLPHVPYKFCVFDMIVDLLTSQCGRARKGNARKFKLGEKGCQTDTDAGMIGKDYAGKNVGDSIFDPVFVLAAILEWAEICENQHGYLMLKADFIT